MDRAGWVGAAGIYNVRLPYEENILRRIGASAHRNIDFSTAPAAL